jgi:prefoldin subunit 5
MEERLGQLREEYEKGRQQLALLHQRRQEVQNTLLRISGAIQVLEELMAAESGPAAEPVPAHARA